MLLTFLAHDLCIYEDKFVKLCEKVKLRDEFVLVKNILEIQVHFFRNACFHVLSDDHPYM